MEGVKTWLSSQAADFFDKGIQKLIADFFDKGIQKLIPRYGKCLNSSGNYVEK
jgi:hypothetical protein